MKKTKFLADLIIERNVKPNNSIHKVLEDINFMYELSEEDIDEMLLQAKDAEKGMELSKADERLIGLYCECLNLPYIDKNTMTWHMGHLDTGVPAVIDKHKDFYVVGRTPYDSKMFYASSTSFEIAGHFLNILAMEMQRFREEGNDMEDGIVEDEGNNYIPEEGYLMIMTREQWLDYLQNKFDYRRAAVVYKAKTIYPCESINKSMIWVRII